MPEVKNPRQRNGRPTDARAPKALFEFCRLPAGGAFAKGLPDGTVSNVAIAFLIARKASRRRRYSEGLARRDDLQRRTPCRRSEAEPRELNG